MEDKNITTRLLAIHQCLSNFFGPLHWWPGDSDLEIMVGAILTQNTNWQNVSRAIDMIKSEELLDVKALFNIDELHLGGLIKSCGYFNLKARRLKNFIHFFYLRYGGSTEKMFDLDWRTLRKELLDVNGIGPETADSILLYAGKKPVFVIDAYTRRIFQRHGYISLQDSYEQIQQYFMRHLPKDHRLYNEYHAQIVMVGKNYCNRKNPNCQDCPLSIFMK
jgi:endonuclease III related protein